MRKNGRRKAKSCEDMYFARVLAGSFWCLRDTWGGRRGYGGSLGAGKAKTDGLEMRNLMKLPMHGDGTQSFVNLGYSVRISLISD